MVRSIELPWPGWGQHFSLIQQTGWQPLPFTEFVVKIHGRCNLACDYCYVYEMADQSWRVKPKAMSRDTFARACWTIAEHATHNGVGAVELVFHGGEPLLAGPVELEHFARTAREILESNLVVRLGIQTNGVLIDDDVLRVCERWNVQVGVSLDGGESEHNLHRLDRRGKGSYSLVAAGLERLLSDDYSHLFSGLLCTIDLDNDPVHTYEELLSFRPPAIDFLLPHGNWLTPPPPGCTPDSAAAPYAQWLIAVFDRWYNAPELETHVRTFGDIIDLLLGGHPVSESVGLAPIRLAVIETDGSLEQVDELKSVFDGAAHLSSVTEGNGNILDQALWEPMIMARQIGASALCDTCAACPINTVCGGGHYVHRYREGSGFRNPSIYCRDLKKLIGHIESRVRTELAAGS